MSKTEQQYEAICYLNYDGLTGYVPCPKCASDIVEGEWDGLVDDGGRRTDLSESDGESE